MYIYIYRPTSRTRHPDEWRTYKQNRRQAVAHQALKADKPRPAILSVGRSSTQAGGAQAPIWNPS